MKTETKTEIKLGIKSNESDNSWMSAIKDLIN